MHYFYSSELNLAPDGKAKYQPPRCLADLFIGSAAKPVDFTAA
jgi:hypothetical protein